MKSSLLELHKLTRTLRSSNFNRLYQKILFLEIPKPNGILRTSTSIRLNQKRPLRKSKNLKQSCASQLLADRNIFLGIQKWPRIMWTLTSSRPYQQQPLRASKTNYNPGQLNRKQTVSKTASSKIKNEQESCAPQSLVGCIEKKHPWK